MDHKVKRPSVKLDYICDFIRNRIIEGDYPAGEYIPAASSLSAQQNISAATIARAVKVLADEGWLMPVSNNRPPRVHRFHPGMRQGADGAQ